MNYSDIFGMYNIVTLIILFGTVRQQGTEKRKYFNQKTKP